VIVEPSILWHEASHATIRHVLGLSVEEVSVVRDGDSYGHVSGLKIESRIVAKAAVFGGNPALVTHELLGLAAGPVGEFIATGATILPRPFDWERYGGANDRAVTQEIVEAHDGVFRTDFHDLVGEAYDMLREPSIWECVCRVVRELKHTGELDHDYFVAALEGAYATERG
jgi:hypothetical protein